ncbi:hypothetical protein [Candidatus Hakubella thermalkaliphila]|uniref:hypothetical protein n=1 Tax=Candidatus Hakubella thermalkaliphila TaxID=2754717 RepID=UPI001594BE85|nr:hypothetical protein [Candidatus Hakubella thermalkaliphila]
MIEQLVDLWIEGSYIGNPKSLFESYKGIANAGLKKATRTRFKSLYSKMKNLNPRLVQVDWKEAKAEKKAELGRPFDLD